MTQQPAFGFRGLHDSNHVLLPDLSRKYPEVRFQRPIPLNFIRLFRGVGVFVFLPLGRLCTQVWMCILEKAIAKIQGNYQQLNGGLVSEGWKIMCGANDTDIENWEAG